MKTQLWNHLYMVATCIQQLHVTPHRFPNVILKQHRHKGKMFVGLVFVKEIVVTWYILFFFSLPRKFDQNYTMKSPINMYISL